MAERPATPADLVWSDGPVPGISEQRLALFCSGEAYASVETCWWGTDDNGSTGWIGAGSGVDDFVRAHAGATGWWWAWLGTINLDV